VGIGISAFSGTSIEVVRLNSIDTGMDGYLGLPCTISACIPMPTDPCLLCRPL
jgi:hypothetical protein